MKTFLIIFSLGLLFIQPESLPKCYAKLESSDGYALSRMEAYSWVLLQLKEDYVDPSRIRPDAMLKATLEYLERGTAEVEIKLKNGYATVQVGSKQQKFKVGHPASIWEMNYNLHPIFKFIDENLESGTDAKDIEFAAINGMLSTLDPHSNLLPPELFREMQLKTTGEFGGLGIRITIRDGALTIISPMPDTPAARMGLKAKDKIVRIGDQSTENMPLDEAVNLLRGKKGTKVTIWVMRQGWSEPHRFVVTRDIIRVRSVVSKLMENNVGYIQIQDFGRHTAGDVLRHLTAMKRESKGLKGLVLDLRNNAGGLMKAAVQVADLFLKQGVIVATVTYDDDYSETKRQKRREVQNASEDGVEQDLPIVVLVNNGSASASEILSGALKNLNRAVLMGQQTFGKGTVQILNERVPDSVEGACLKLTVAEYLIPGDISIQEIGVTPDIQLTPIVLEKDDIQLFAEREYRREEDIKSHFKTKKSFDQKPSENIRYVFEEDTEEKSDENTEPTAEGPKDPDQDQESLEEPEFVEDFEIKLAREFLLKTPSSKGSDMLDQGMAFLRQVQKEQQEKIESKMKQLSIDWSKGEGLGARGEVSYEIVGDQGKTVTHAQADQEVELRLKVRNVGTAPFFRLRAETKCKNPLYDKKEFLFGRVGPNETGTFSVPIKIPRAAISRTEELRFVFSSESSHPPMPFETTIRTKELDRPIFGFSYQVLDTKGNGDGLVQPGETIELKVTVYNQGKGKAFHAKSLIMSEAGKDVYLETGKGRVSYKEILPGQAVSRSFVFTVQDNLTSDNLPFELSIWDAELGTSNVANLQIPVYKNKSAHKIQSMTTGLLITQKSAELFSGADSQSPKLAKISRGKRVLSDLQVGPWFRIHDQEKQPVGWIHKNNVKKVAASSVKPTEKTAWTAFAQFTPPVIKLETIPEYLTTGPSITVKGEVLDRDQPIRDAAIWVNSEKVFLKAGANLKNPHRMKLRVPIQLNPGPNVISIIAREGKTFSNSHTVVVTVPGGLDWKEEDQTLADKSQPKTDMD